jgi:AraC-like DNA-binding protein
MTARVFREVMGSSWTPVRVEFMGKRPADTRLFKAFFRCRVEFDAPRNALVVTRSDFERPLQRHNPELVDFFEYQLRRQSAAWPVQIDDLVTGLLMSELAGGPPSLAQVASRLGLAPRTLQRRLAAGGTSFGDLLAAARRDVAEAHLRRMPRTPLSWLAFEMGLSDATAASRFLRLKMNSPGLAAEAE